MRASAQLRSSGQQPFRTSSRESDGMVAEWDRPTILDNLTTGTAVDLYREHDDFVKLFKRHTARDSYLRGYRNFFVSVAVFPILRGLTQVTSVHCVSHHMASIYLQPSIRSTHPQHASTTRDLSSI